MTDKLIERLRQAAEEMDSNWAADAQEGRQIPYPFNFALEAAARIEALEAMCEKLAGVMGMVREDLAMVAPVPLADPYILIELRGLCERSGYGNVMSSASALWRQALQELAGGEFVSGPCRSTVVKDLARVDQALTDYRSMK